MNNILLTTTHSLDGYRIIKYLDVISSEAIYKLSVGKSLSTMLSDAVDSRRIFSNNELSGTTQLIQEAKEYVKSELVKKAKALGANSVVGIDIESSVSSDGVAKASINGTAVIIEPVNTIAPAFKLPVVWYNRDPGFKPSFLSVSGSGSSLSLDLFAPSHEKLSAILMDVTFTTIFDENFEMKDIAFTNFSLEKNNHLVGDCNFCSIPKHILSMLKNSSVLIKKYVEAGHVIELSGESLNLDQNNDMQNSAGETLSARDLLFELDSLDTTKEILEYLKEHSEQYPHLIDSELIALVEERVYIERLYGKRKPATIAAIKNFFDIKD